MENSRTKNTLLNAVGGVAVRIITLLTMFITRTIFIRVLGMEYAGVSGVFTDVLTMLSFAELGIGQAITYALYRPIATGDEKQIAKLMNVYRRIYMVIAAIVLAVGTALIPFLKYIIKDVPSVKEDIKIIYIFYLLNTASSYLLIYKATFLTAAQKDYVVSKFRAIVSVVKAAIECVLLLVFKNFLIYLAFSVAANLAQNYIVAKVAEKQYPVLKEKSVEKLEPAERKKLFSDVRALALYKVSGTVLNGTDSVITSSMLGTVFVGILGNYNLITNNVYLFVMQLFNATSASIGNLAVKSTPEHQHRIFRQMLFLAFWIYCVCATCLWTLFNPFMYLWQGKENSFSAFVVALLIADFYVKGVLSPISQFRTSNGLFVQGKYRPVIMAALNIGISILLAKYIGIAGIILGTLISRALTQLWYDPWLIYRMVFFKSVWEYFLVYFLYIAVTVGCCAASQFLLGAVYPGSGFVQLIIGLVISLVISNLAIVLLFCSTREFKAIMEIVKKTIRRRV